MPTRSRSTPAEGVGAEGPWRYSNTGYILLGMVLEKASGRTFAQLLSERIFKPLAMQGATFEEGSPPADTPVHGHYDHAAKGTDVTAWNLSQGWAAGVIVCAAEELACSGHALLDSTLFVKLETTARMREFVDGRAGLAAAACLGYGIGWQQFAPGGLGHRGQTLGFHGILMLFPQSRSVAVRFTNDALGPSILLQMTLGRILSAPAASRVPVGAE